MEAATRKLTLLHRLDRLEGAGRRGSRQREMLLAAVGRRRAAAAAVSSAAVRMLAQEANHAALLWAALARCDNTE